MFSLGRENQLQLFQLTVFHHSVHSGHVDTSYAKIHVEITQSMGLLYCCKSKVIFNCFVLVRMESYIQDLYFDVENF